jgi:Protein of unknown function (DUF2917)
MFATLNLRQAIATHVPSALLRAWRDSRVPAPGRSATPPCATRSIARQQTLRLPAALGQRIECLEGCLWITMDHDPRDVVVMPGEAFTADRHQRVLVHALQPSCVRLVRPAR